MSHVITTYFRITKSKERFAVDSKRLEAGTYKHEQAFPINKIFKNFKEANVANRKVYIINDKGDDSQDILFYFHGGGYLYPITKFHWKLLKKIASKMDAKIIVPIYGRVPESNYKVEFPILVEVFNKYKTKNHKNFFGGDSAGGGMALGLSYWLKDKGFELPDSLFLFSPWMDVSMDNPEIEEVKPKVTMLGYNGLNIIGEMWSCGNLKDKYCSPNFGNIEDLPPIFLYTGTYDILYPDMKIFQKLMEEKKKQLVFRVYPKMEHVFIAYPLLREANKAFKDLYKDWMVAKSS